MSTKKFLLKIGKLNPQIFNEIIFPRFGASDHMARLIIEVRKYDKSYREGINFSWTSKISKILQEYSLEKNWEYAGIDRVKEPDEVRMEDGKSMPWKVSELVRKCSGRVPRLFYEGPGFGKEPFSVLLGKDAVEVVIESVEIAKGYASII